jgi:hypothetical protein
VVVVAAPAVAAASGARTPEDARDTDEDCQHTKDNDQRADVGPRCVKERPRARIDRASDPYSAAIL